MFFKLSTAWYTPCAAAITCDTNPFNMQFDALHLLNLYSSVHWSYLSFSVEAQLQELGIWGQQLFHKSSWEFGVYLVNNLQPPKQKIDYNVWKIILKSLKNNYQKGQSVAREQYLHKAHKFKSGLSIIGLIESSPTSVSSVRTDMLYSGPQHWQLSSWSRP